jgi:type I restriction enzyme S subunit
MTEATRNLLEQHFGTAFAASDGIAKLRELILTLAMQGKLVEQDENDPPASELLKEIESEKRRLVKAGEIKQPKPLPDIGQVEIPHMIPKSWAWVRFGDIAQHNSGKTLDKGRNTGQPRDYITTSNLYWGRFELDNVRQMLIRDNELEKCTAKKNDLLICEGGEAGRAAVWNFDSEVCFQNHVHRARFYKDIDPYFAYRFFEKLNATGEINQHRKGVGISNMSSKALASIVFPLPPLPEQHRIVARIDQLMARCDELEKLRKDREEKRLAVHAAAIKQLLVAPNGSAWGFIQQHFGELYTVKENVAELRKAILQLAVMGRLVPQNPNDGETRTVTMEELVGRKNLKNGLSLSPVDRPSDFVCLPLSAMKGSTIDCRFGKPIAIAADRAEPYLIKPRDVFIIRGNGSKERVGIAGMARVCPPNVLFPDLFIRVPLPPNKIDGDYFLIAWNSPVTREVLEGLAATTSGIWKVNQGHITGCEFPLPPLAEQKRIVAKVDELMALCDTLDQQIDAATGKQVELLNAVMAQV